MTRQDGPPALRPGVRILAAAAALALLTGAAAAADPAKEKPGDDAPRYTRGAHQYRIDSGPAVEALPEELRFRPEADRFPSDSRSFDGAATEAGRWAAEEVARRKGAILYYRAGFYDGSHRALKARPESAADYAEGLKAGSHDPGALHHGSLAGSAAAEEVARSEAARRVEAQFMDLGCEPAFDPAAIPPPYTPEVAPITGPSVEDLFRTITAAHVPGLDRTYHDAFDGWRFDPWTLYEAKGYADFLDRRSWASPDDAFDLWRDGHKRSAVYRSLQLPSDRQRFREVFRAAFAARLAMLYDSELTADYRIGHRDGWRYGSVAVDEWRYRQGYAEGFNQAAVTAAGAAYLSLYPATYAGHYGDEFRTWSQTAHPGIVSFRVRDGSDDGIFQPGETVDALVELANYGGAAGQWTVTLDSPLFDHPIQADVDVPARSVTTPADPIVASIRPTVEKGRKEDVGITVGTLQRTIPIEVSYPFQFTGQVRLASVDVIAGRATAEVEVANRSRRPVSGDLRLVGDAGLEITPANARLDGVGPGEIRRASFRIERMKPLAELAGQVSLRFEVSGPEALHDVLAYDFPAIALDLDSGELERFLLMLASDKGSPSSEVKGALDLALERIAADWEVVADGPGNPYKEDYEQRGRATALGRLVSVYTEARSRLENRKVFRQLGDEIESMADDLPGAHPFLRKYVIRLARRLG